MMAPDACWALRRGQVHHVTHRSRLRCSHIDHAAAGSICVPIVGQGQTRGLLQIAAYHEEWDNPKQGEITLRRLRTMAVRVGPELANLKLREMLRTLSIRDPLTGLFNRRYLEESLARELHRAARSNRPLAAIMIDIDHFKRFNDEFGHDVGDLVLRAFAELVLEHIRKSDMACRLGGKELVVVLPDAGLEVAVARAEALRAAIHGLSLRYQDKPLGTVTASFGVAVYPEHGVDAEALLHAGDCALYRAKREGRNRVCVASAV
jgi:diguanylate cyclase (GGDEF)-like protein